MDNEIKKAFYVNSSFYLEELREETFNYDTAVPLIEDPIRYFSKNFWVLQNNTVTQAYNFGNRLYDVESFNDSTIILKANKYNFTEINEQGILNKTFSPKIWENFLKNIRSGFGRDFIDSCFIIQEPNNISEVSDIDRNSNFINKEHVYNFYSNKYDALLSDRNIDIRTIPDVFSIINDNQLQVNTYEENLKLSYGGLISDDKINPIFTSKQTSSDLISYFNKISEVYDTEEATIVLNQLKILNSSYILDKKINKLLRELKYIPFPYYVDIKFSNKAKNKDTLINFLNDYPDATTELLNFLNERSSDANQFNFIYNNKNTESVKVRSYDLKNWLAKNLSGPETINSTSDVYVQDSYRPYRQLDYANIIEYIKKNIKIKLRKFTDFMKPNENNEILFYKIEKRLFGANSNNILQTYWIKPDESDFLRLIDTQVRYGINYYYKIYAYSLNVANTYSYREYYKSRLERDEDIKNGLYKVSIINNPAYQICEVEIANIFGAVHEPPPTKPKISISQEKSLVKFTIHPSAHEEYENYKFIEDRDFNLLESIRVSQDNENQEYIKFKGAPLNTVELEVYKTAIYPTDYLALQGKRYRTIALNGETSINDTVVAGVKYYYVFRYINKHMYPSNPTQVYEVQLKDEDGYLYLETKMIDIEATQPTKNFKNMRRYLLIRPSMIQLQKKLPKNITSIDDVNLGPNGPNIWNSYDKKEFLLRITSKKTNRVIEFDLGSLINRKKN